MALVLRVLLGLVIVAVGAGMVIRTRVLLEFFGPIAWAEAKMGGGGSNLLYKLIGIFFCFIGFMVATNLWMAFLQGTIGWLFNYNTQAV